MQGDKLSNHFRFTILQNFCEALFRLHSSNNPNECVGTAASQLRLTMTHTHTHTLHQASGSRSYWIRGRSVVPSESGKRNEWVLHGPGAAAADGEVGAEAEALDCS